MASCIMRYSTNYTSKTSKTHGITYHSLKTKIIFLVVLFMAGALSRYFLTIKDKTKTIEPPDPILPLPPSTSLLHTFKKAAVCTDSPPCSVIGRNILALNGSVVDATIAAMFCNGILSLQSVGLGGGFFMIVYIKAEEKAYTVIARETAPAAATKDMFHGNAAKAKHGPLSYGVPGQLRGMWAVHKRWGRLPWNSLIKPTLMICETGFSVTEHLYSGRDVVPSIKNDPILRKQLIDPETNEFYPPGTNVKPSKQLCRTLKIIAEKGGDDLYNGTLAVEFIEDMKKAGSIITAEDLKNYQAKILDPITVKLSNGDTLYTPPAPSSGPILANILIILSGYNFTTESINGTDNQVLTYHRIIEAFKFAYAAKTKLGDEDYLNLREFIANITSPQYGMEIRERINDTTTSNSTEYYGATEYNQDDHGTAHISALAENGDAVSMTDSINFYFGAGTAAPNTGIIMNNVMDDFSTPGVINYFKVKPSPANFIAPGKRPLSSMCPSIIVDRNGNAKLIIGAAGGTKITTAIALVAVRKLWFDQTIKEAVDIPRFHHQIFPMKVFYQFGMTQDVIKGLKDKGHEMERYIWRGSIVCALYRNKTSIYANADYRKGGDVAGID